MPKQWKFGKQDKPNSLHTRKKKKKKEKKKRGQYISHCRK